MQTAILKPNYPTNLNKSIKPTRLNQPNQTNHTDQTDPTKKKLTNQTNQISWDYLRLFDKTHLNCFSRGSCENVMQKIGEIFYRIDRCNRVSAKRVLQRVCQLCTRKSGVGSFVENFRPHLIDFQIMCTEYVPLPGNGLTYFIK